MALRRILLGAAALAGSSGAAGAADLPLAPLAAPAAVAQDRWAGPYVGLFAGYGRGDARATAPFDAGSGFFYNFGGSPYRFDADGFFGGAVAGYEWRRNSIVAGLEAEVGHLGLRGSTLDPNGIAAGFDDTTTALKTGLYGALYARLGFAADNLLLYVKGGGALLRAKATTVDPCIAPPVGCGTETLRMSGSRALPGWSLGAGVEWEAAPDWSVKAEYAYFDFGRVRTAGVSSEGDFYTQRVGARAHTVKLGIVHRFGSASGRAAAGY